MSQEIVSVTDKYPNRVFQLNEQAASNKNRILVVDDEEFCLGAMKTLLQKSGFDVANRIDFCINGLESV